MPVTFQVGAPPPPPSPVYIFALYLLITFWSKLLNLYRYVYLLAICTKIWTKQLPKKEKNALPVDRPPLGIDGENECNF